MKVITFQNYRVAKEVNEKGIFKSKVRREWVEEELGCEAVKRLVQKFNENSDIKIDKPVFGMTEFKVWVTPSLDSYFGKPVQINHSNLDVNIISNFIAKSSSMLSDMLGVDILSSSNVMMCLDVPDEYVLEYSQEGLNYAVANEDLSDLDSIYVKGSYGVTSCIMPYIKKEWVEGVYTFTYNTLTDLIVLECNADCSKLNVFKGLAYSPVGNVLKDITPLVSDMVYTVSEVLERYDVFNGWECRDYFDRELFLEYVCRVTKRSMEQLEKYDLSVDENNVFKSFENIMCQLYNDL